MGIYYEVKYDCGRVVEVEKIHSFKYGKRGYKKEPVKGLTPEQMNAINERNRSKKLRRKILVNFKEGDLWVTLTYSRDKRPASEAGAVAEIKRFIRKMKYRFKKAGVELKWILTTEIMASTVHHHMILNNPEEVDAMKLVNECWKNGHPCFKSLYQEGDFRELADYVVKEAKGRVKKTSYTCSRNLKEPIVKRRVVSANSWRQQPRAPQGYAIDKSSIFSGIHEMTGYPYQYYTMHKLDRKEKGSG